MSRLSDLIGGGGVGNVDRLWEHMEEAGWNAQAVVDKVNPYTRTAWERENKNGRKVTGYSNNDGQRRKQVEALQGHYNALKDKDRTITGTVLRLGSADPGAQMLNPKSEADVDQPNTAAATQRQDFGAGADSGRGPAEGSNRGAGMNVDTTKRRRSGINI